MIICKTRTEALEMAYSHEYVVKVEGGYAIMNAVEYKNWRNQK